jgi:outer membrane immunogenic protein
MSRHLRALALSVCIATTTIGLSWEFASAGTSIAPLVVGGSNSGSASSWVGGGHVGYNWQNGAWVYGLEGDISGMHLKTDFNTMLSTGATANTNSTVDWYGTVRGRLGWASGPVFFYGTGGFAFGGVDLNSAISSNVGPPRSVISQTSDTKGGWVAGAGLDYLWRPDLIVKLAYQYVDLGSISVAGTNTAFSALLSQNATANARFSVVTLGLSWRFAPGSGGPWAGFYAGGQAGGAWGNHTEASYIDQVPQFSDSRLKRDVALVTRLGDGLGLYRYRYLWSNTIYVGVMAQEVALIHPDAIVRSNLDDYLRVDYSRLGLRLMTLPEWNARNVSKRL